MAHSSFGILTPLPDEFPDAPDLDQRLEKLADVDKKIQDLLLTAKEILMGYDKERQNAKAKMDTIHKRYEDNVDAIHSGISDQLVYMERMCVGAEHQGSTFPIQQQSELMRNRTESLRNEFGRIADLAAYRRTDAVENSMLAGGGGATVSSALAHLKSLELTAEDDALIESVFADLAGDEQNTGAEQMDVQCGASAGSASGSSVQMDESGGNATTNYDDENVDKDQDGGAVEEVEIDSDN